MKTIDAFMKIIHQKNSRRH